LGGIEGCVGSTYSEDLDDADGDAAADALVLVVEEVLVDKLRGNGALELRLDGCVVLAGVDELVRQLGQTLDQLCVGDGLVGAWHERLGHLEQRLGRRHHRRVLETVRGRPGARLRRVGAEEQRTGRWNELPRGKDA